MNGQAATSQGKQADLKLTSPPLTSLTQNPGAMSLLLSFVIAMYFRTTL